MTPVLLFPKSSFEIHSHLDFLFLESQLLVEALVLLVTVQDHLVTFVGLGNDLQLLNDTTK